MLKLKSDTLKYDLTINGEINRKVLKRFNEMLFRYRDRPRYYVKTIFNRGGSYGKRITDRWSKSIVVKNTYKEPDFLKLTDEFNNNVDVCNLTLYDLTYHYLHALNGEDHSYVCKVSSYLNDDEF